MLLVRVTGISKPGNSRRYPGNWQKGNNENAIFILKRASWRISYELLPRGRDLGDDKLPCPGFPTFKPGTRVPGAQILGEYEVLLVPVTSISKPGKYSRVPG